MVKTKQPSHHEETLDEPVAAVPVRARMRSLFQPGLLAAVMLLIAAISFGPRLMKSLPDLSGLEEFRLPAREIEVTPPPHWVPHDLIEQVLAQSQLPDELSLLDKGLTARIAEAFQHHPWVEEVVRVTKSTPAQVKVELTYRQPAAMVQVKQGLYPVDRLGVLLPPGDFSPAEARRYPLIVNAATPPQGSVGTSWGDVAVTGAAQIAAALNMHWKDFGIDYIEIPPVATARPTIDELVYHLHTTGGSRIIWGRAPENSHPGELTAAQKIGRMEEYVTRFGGFDQPHGPYEIDIRHLQLISRKPLAEVPAPASRR